MHRPATPRINACHEKEEHMKTIHEMFSKLAFRLLRWRFRLQ